MVSRSSDSPTVGLSTRLFYPLLDLLPLSVDFGCSLPGDLNWELLEASSLPLEADLGLLEGFASMFEKKQKLIYILWLVASRNIKQDIDDDTL